MLRQLRASTVIISTVFSTACHAATLEDLQGKVLVDHGHGFRLATGPGILKAGDRVMAVENSKATIKYDGCSIKADEGAVVTVGASDACAALNAANQLTGAIGDPAAATAATTPGAAPSIGAAGASAGIASGATTVALVAAAAVGVGAIVYVASKKANGSSP